MKKADFSRLRSKIDHADRDLLRALAKRFASALEIGRIKAKLGIPVIQKSRFRELLKERIEMGRKQGISPKFIRALFHLIHDESVRVQMKVRKQ